MRIWILAVATVAVLIGVAGGSYWYGNHSSDKPVLVSNAPSAASEGIKVHGDWEITVSDPNTDEEMVYAFSNELANTGSAVLAYALQGQGITRVNDIYDSKGKRSDIGTHYWSLGVHKTTPAIQGYFPAHIDWTVSYCGKGLGVAGEEYQRISNHKDSQQGDTYGMPLLTTRLIKSGTGIDEVTAFELVGSCEVSENMDMSGVSTGTSLTTNMISGVGEDYIHTAGDLKQNSDGSYGPSGCNLFDGGFGCPFSTFASHGRIWPRFTEKILDSPISVREGQTINVVVRISFE